MKIKEEIKQLDKEWKTMNIHFKAFIETKNQEDLHKFRVQIKKLKAMLSLFESTSHSHNLMKSFKPIKEIFKHAGHIREAYTNLQLGEHYQLKNEIFELGQQLIIEQATNEFKLNGKKFIKRIKQSRKEVKKKLARIHNRLIADYYKNQLEEIAVNFTVSGFTEDMHTNRKLIKILVYNHKIAEKALKGSLHFNVEYLDKLQDTIGKWHDNIVAEQLFSSPGLNDKLLVAKIKRINAGVKRTISNLADDFINKSTTINKAIKVN